MLVGGTGWVGTREASQRAGRWQAAVISFYQPWKGGQEACEDGRLRALPTRWGWRHCTEHAGARLDAAHREHPRSAVAPASSLGGRCASSPALLGGSGLTGSRFSCRCCRTARKPAGKWSCTGGHRSARTLSASWTSMRISTRGGSVCSSSWSGESPAVPLQVGSPCRSTCSSAGQWGDAKRGVSTFLHPCQGVGDPREMLCRGMQPVSCRDARPGRGAALLVLEGRWELRWL